MLSFEVVLGPESMTRELRLLAMFQVLSVGMCFSQIPNPSPQTGTTPRVELDCSDPSQAESPECLAQSQSLNLQQGQYSPSPIPQLRAPYDTGQSPPPTPPPNPSQHRHPTTTPSPETQSYQMIP